MNKHEGLSRKILSSLGTCTANTEDRDQSGGWWKSLGREECPITLEPLATLPYPPFVIQGASSSNAVSYFDGLALASYIVSRGIFQNPLTRQDLTLEDCLRLDEYLDEHRCWLTSDSFASGTDSRRALSVAEAFRLRQSVQVEANHRGGLSIGIEQLRQEQQRAEILRNTATAALAGLFVYGNERRRSQQSRLSGHRHLDDNTGPAGDIAINEVRSDHGQSVDWGFDLYRQVEESADYASEGWTVIDDDEEMVVATERQRYQATQDAFPRLQNNSTSSATGETPVIPIDTELVQTLHAMSLKEQHEASRAAHRLEIARQKLLCEALQRREERKREWKRRVAEEKQKLQHQKAESEEMERIQQEIESWREEQWDVLRKKSELRKEELERQRRQLEQKQSPVDTTSEVDTSAPNDTILKGEPDIANEEEIASQKKAKAAAKRRRAKERKKTQKAQEREVEAQKKKEMELESRRASSGVKCAACGEGVLGYGFEKYNQKYCSPKCARTATKP